MELYYLHFSTGDTECRQELRIAQLWIYRSKVVDEKQTIYIASLKQQNIT